MSTPGSAGIVREVGLHQGELLRTYQTAVAMLPVGVPPIIELISATAGEGTSTIAHDLALAVAESTGARVLLLRVTPAANRPSSAGPDGPGLEMVLRGELGIEKLLSKSGDVPFFVASLSPITIVGRDRLSSLRELLERLITWVDVVIIDAPAASSDFAGLALVGLAGGVILVVEAEHTQSLIIRQAKLQIEASGGRILGVVLNKRRRNIPAIFNRWLGFDGAE
jgi:Mrp family chromosome partitioning ATPase